jgi:Holliday junction resolvase RusA-like endonuclease
VKLTFRLLGPPRQLDRARAMIAGAGPTCPRCGNKQKQWVRFYDPKVNTLNKKWIQDAAMEAKQHAGVRGVDSDHAYELVVLYLLHKPPSKRRKNSNPHPFPTVKPDLSNCVKLIEDALNELVWKDDSQICNLRVYKRYTHDEPQASIYIRPLTEPECGNPLKGPAPQQAEIPTTEDL